MHEPLDKKAFLLLCVQPQRAKNRSFPRAIDLFQQCIHPGQEGRKKEKGNKEEFLFTKGCRRTLLEEVGKAKQGHDLQGWSSERAK